MKTFTPLLTTIIAISSLTSSTATNFNVDNQATGTAGGNRFDRQIGVEYTTEVLREASSLFSKLFANRKNFNMIYVTIQSMNGVSNCANNAMYISSEYIGDFSGDIKFEFTGIVYHEMARVLQWNGHEHAPIGLLTGMADFFRLKAGYAPPRWAKSGEGARWDEGFDVTARFLEYCDGEYGGIVSFLNSKMRFGYDGGFFKEYSGKSVDELWHEYVAKYIYI